MTERLNKVLAQHGIGSRREVERWIVEGRLELNNKRVKLGDRYSEGDRVSLDGRDITKRLVIQATVQVLGYHKPQGQLIERSTSSSADDATDEPEDMGETVMDRLPKQRGVRWVPINPMHAGDSGLLLFTNDGNLSYALTRQKKSIPTAYMVRVHVRGGFDSAPQLPTRMLIDNDIVEFTSVEATGGEGDNVWYKVMMSRADRRAAVRALFVSNDLTVSRMMQIAFADIELTRELPRSRHQLLKPAQVESLYRYAKLQVPTRTAGQRTSSEEQPEDEKYKPRPGKRERLRQRDAASDSASRKTHGKRASADRAATTVKRTTHASTSKAKSGSTAKLNYSRK